jgi:hypothetical protein
MNQVISIKRSSERAQDSKIPHRGNRFFKLGDNWYFTTREGFSMGPYDSHELADKGTEDYLAFVSRADPKILKLLVPDLQAVQA